MARRLYKYKLKFTHMGDVKEFIDELSTKLDFVTSAEDSIDNIMHDQENTLTIMTLSTFDELNDIIYNSNIVMESLTMDIKYYDEWMLVKIDSTYDKQTVFASMMHINLEVPFIKMVSDELVMYVVSDIITDIYEEYSIDKIASIFLLLFKHSNIFIYSDRYGTCVYKRLIEKDQEAVIQLTPRKVNKELIVNFTINGNINDNIIERIFKTLEIYLNTEGCQDHSYTDKSLNVTIPEVTGLFDTIRTVAVFNRNVLSEQSK